MVDGYRTLLDDSAALERNDPVSKAAFFYLSADSARRPEVSRYHDRLSRLSVPGERVLLSAGGDNSRFDETWRLRPPFGPVPPALSDSYPLTAERPDRLDREAYEAAARGVSRLVEANSDVQFAVAHWRWPDAALGALPKRVDVLELSEE
jgi:7-cyano-7-deazaguanine tRNA-ribosyltransferase